MRIVPVLDIMNGQVVRGIAGRRAEYRPVVSQLTASTRPIDVANAIRNAFGFCDFYVADLDAIEGAEPAWGIYGDLHALGCRLWVDCGVRTEARAAQLQMASVSRPVLGLETIPDPEAIPMFCARLDVERTVFSLDLHGGRPLKNVSGWGDDPEKIVAMVVAAGIPSVLVLDLSRVGTGYGLGTEALCTRLRELWPDLELNVGGGVQGMRDLERFRACGVQHVLISSALHDGRLSRQIRAQL